MNGRKKSGQVAGEVPQELIDAFDACVDRLGITKKRAIAAAVHGFVTGNAAQKHAWLQAVYERYYAVVEGGPRSITASEADLGRRVGSAVARGGSKRRSTTGKSSA